MAKRGTLEHPKNRRLARLLDSVPGVTYGLLCVLWDRATEYYKDGAVTRLDIEDALDACGFLSMWSVDQVIEALTNEAQGCIWLDRLEDGRFYIHDWHDHCEDSVHISLARSVKHFANGVRPSMTRIGDKPNKDKNETVGERTRLLIAFDAKEKEESALRNPENVPAHFVRTTSAPPSQAKPSQAMPSHTEPISAGAQEAPPPNAVGVLIFGEEFDFQVLGAWKDAGLDPNWAGSARPNYVEIRARGVPLEAVLDGIKRYGTYVSGGGSGGKSKYLGNWLAQNGWEQKYELIRRASKGPFDRMERLQRQFEEREGA